MKQQIITLNNINAEQITEYTLREIKEIIKRYKTTPAIRILIGKILNGVDGRDFKNVLDRIIKFVKEKVRYQKDVNEIETLQSPLRTIQLGFGDCDDFTILLATLFEAAGYPVKLVLVSNRADKIFNHIFINVCGLDIDLTENIIGKFNLPITARKEVNACS